ncbi:MAG: hypothetical protein K0Q81_2037 [Paenibacillus sp.]|nr:hypothetical protein [Paenibacillus sp.]
MNMQAKQGKYNVYLGLLTKDNGLFRILIVFSEKLTGIISRVIVYLIKVRV